MKPFDLSKRRKGNGLVSHALNISSQSEQLPQTLVIQTWEMVYHGDCSFRVIDSSEGWLFFSFIAVCVCPNMVHGESGFASLLIAYNDSDKTTDKHSNLTDTKYKTTQLTHAGKPCLVKPDMRGGVKFN